MVKIVWSKESGRMGGDLHHANVGPYRVATVSMRLRARGDSAGAWSVTSLLPGASIRADLNRYVTPDDAKSMASLLIKRWFEQALK